MTEKQGLWHRIRNQYDSASTALSNLSINSGEQDGDTEHDTVVHKALVNFYHHRDGQMPPWLDDRSQQQQQQPYGNAYARPTYAQNSRSSSSIHSQASQRGGNALQDIYKRREQRLNEHSQQQQQQQQQQQYQPAYSKPARSWEAPPPPPSQAPQRQDRFKAKLKSTSRANW